MPNTKCDAISNYMYVINNQVNQLHSLVCSSGHVSCKVAMYILIILAILMVTLNEIISTSFRVFNFSVNGLCEVNTLVYHLVSFYCNFNVH